MSTLLTFYNSNKPFVVEENGEYFIYRHKDYHVSDKYTDDPNILLNAIKNVQPGNYTNINGDKKVKTKEEYWQLAFDYMYS